MAEIVDFSGQILMILQAGVVWRPVDLAQPDHTPARGQPST
jgi:hypothetical protein